MRPSCCLQTRPSDNRLSSIYTQLYWWYMLANEWEWLLRGKLLELFAFTFAEMTVLFIVGGIRGMKHYACVLFIANDECVMDVWRDLAGAVAATPPPWRGARGDHEFMPACRCVSTTARRYFGRDHLHNSIKWYILTMYITTSQVARWRPCRASVM